MAFKALKAVKMSGIKMAVKVPKMKTVKLSGIGKAPPKAKLGSLKKY